MTNLRALCTVPTGTCATVLAPRPPVAAIVLLCAGTAHAAPVQMDTLQSEDERLEATAVIDDSEEIALHQAYDVNDIFRDTPSATVGGTTASSDKIYLRGIEDTNLDISVDGASQNGYRSRPRRATVMTTVLAAAMRRRGPAASSPPTTTTRRPHH